MPEPEQRMIRNAMKKYMRKMVGINLASAAIFWREAIEEKLIHLPTEIEDKAWWGAIMLGWEIADMSDEAALEETTQPGSPDHRRQVQRAVCAALMDVYRGAFLVPSMNIKQAIPVNLGAKLMSLAMNPQCSVECTMEVLRVFQSFCTCPELSKALMEAFNECEISRQKDHLSYVLNNEVLGTSSLGYGIFIARESPSDASDRYEVQLPSLREFQLKAMTGEDEF